MIPEGAVLPQEVFEAYGSDAPFFAEVARQRMERECARDLLILGIGSAVRDFVDHAWPPPVFVRPSLFNSEEALDIRMMELEASDYSEAQAAARIASGEAVSSVDKQYWYMKCLDRLVLSYGGDNKMSDDNKEE